MRSVFVRATEGQYALLGIGKLIARQGPVCTVEYFDSPTSDPVVQTIDQQFLERVTIAEQTRIYHYDENTGYWEIGRLLDDHGDTQLVQFPNSKARHLEIGEVFVRWACPIQDPTSFLANRINESPRFSDSRSAFVRSQMRQRAASMGMSALLACAVELEAHQIEVVRRVLQDPVQRYLLADEVGLGKTIEAGVLIRQCALDAQHNCSILVLVPEALVNQWRNELANKFFLGRSLDRIIHILAFEDSDRIRAILPKATMLVIDEAHHLTSRSWSDDYKLYTEIARFAPKVDRVLLLSATPALHNERGFLKMLHLLDPAAYPLDDEAAFRQKIEGRRALAEIVAGLTPENLLFLDYTIDQLVSLFPADSLLQEHAASLRSVTRAMPEESDPVLVEAIGRLRAHLSEVYRLHRRILRHRRRSIGGLTPERAGAQIVRYRSPERVAVVSAMEDWRFENAPLLGPTQANGDWSECVGAFWQMLDHASQHAWSHEAKFNESDQSSAVARYLGRAELFEKRADALISALRPLLQADSKCVVFCSDPLTADMLTRRIAEHLGIWVDRHDPENEDWMEFGECADHFVLVCDRHAEEGLNLQGGKKVVVHYDLPFNPNRIEQRLGRVDRYGAGDAVRSLIITCEDDPLEIAWVNYLETALKVFDRSIASLQYVIEQTLQGIARALITDGVQALTDLTRESVGDQGLIERELKVIEQQDALDALDTPSTDFVDEISEVDEDWQALSNDTALWLEQMLQLGRIEEADFGANGGLSVPFRYVYSTGNRHTLLPLPIFMAHCSDALDLSPVSRGDRVLKTIPYTFRRRTALQRDSRAKGVGLLRYGDALMSGMMALTDADDRGRSFAMWRYAPDHHGDPLADFYFRFDFIVEADVSKTLEIARAQGRGNSAASSAVRRRGDMALPAFYRTIWLDRELKPVVDETRLALLARSFSNEPGRNGALDVNLNTQRWQHLLKLPLPEVSHWSELCGKARFAADAHLRGHPDFIDGLARAEKSALKVDLGRIGQLRARAGVTADEGDYSELALEEQLAAALRSGIRSPRIRVDTVGVVFVSANRAATDRVLGGN